MVLPYMTDAEFDALEPVMADGWATLREWHGNMTVTVRRQDGTATAPLPVVSIRLADRMEQASGTVATATAQSGTLRLWTADVDATPIRQGDRFLWNLQACQITTGPVEKRGGVSEYGFRLEIRNL